MIDDLATLELYLYRDDFNMPVTKNYDINRYRILKNVLE